MMTRRQTRNLETYRAERGRRTYHDGEIQLAVAFLGLSLLGMALMAILMGVW